MRKSVHSASFSAMAGKSLFDGAVQLSDLRAALYKCRLFLQILSFSYFIFPLGGKTRPWKTI